MTQVKFPNFPVLLFLHYPTLHSINIFLYWNGRPNLLSYDEWENSTTCVEYKAAHEKQPGFVISSYTKSQHLGFEMVMISPKIRNAKQPLLDWGKCIYNSYYIWVTYFNRYVYEKWNYIQIFNKNANNTYLYIVCR